MIKINIAFIQAKERNMKNKLEKEMKIKMERTEMLFLKLLMMLMFNYLPSMPAVAWTKGVTNKRKQDR